jgi:hypothetical protein
MNGLYRATAKAQKKESASQGLRNQLHCQDKVQGCENGKQKRGFHVGSPKVKVGEIANGPNLDMCLEQKGQKKDPKHMARDI